MGKLFTKEDPYHFHKIFGLLSLTSFVYRYLYVWPLTGNLGVEYDALGVGTIAVHMMLSASAIIFKVPQKRIPKNPVMIWNEYRLHAIVFTARSVIAYCLGIVLTTELTLEGQATRLVAVVSMHAVADVVSHFYGAPGQTTVRGNSERPPRMLLVQRLTVVYGAYQILALASQLLPHARAMDLGYNTIIAIQSSAFCMTLNRKGFIVWKTHAIVYSICLLFSAAFIVQVHGSWSFGAAFLAAYVARTRLRMSKYGIWATFALGHADASVGAAIACVALGHWALTRSAKEKEEAPVVEVVDPPKADPAPDSPAATQEPAQEPAQESAQEPAQEPGSPVSVEYDGDLRRAKQN